MILLSCRSGEDVRLHVGSPYDAIILAPFVGGGEGAGLHAGSHEDVVGGDGAGLYAGNSPSSSAQCGSWKLRWYHCKPAAPDTGAVGVASVKLKESAKLHAGRLPCHHRRLQRRAARRQQPPVRLRGRRPSTAELCVFAGCTSLAELHLCARGVTAEPRPSLAPYMERNLYAESCTTPVCQVPTCAYTPG
jgi:hypothetical protein